MKIFRISIKLRIFLYTRHGRFEDNACFNLQADFIHLQNLYLRVNGYYDQTRFLVFIECQQKTFAIRRFLNE